MAKLVNKKAAIEDPNKLSGPEKAAVILLALGEEHTALWERLDDDEVKEISQAMATLGNVTAEAVEALMIIMGIHEFATIRRRRIAPSFPPDGSARP